MKKMIFMAVFTAITAFAAQAQTQATASTDKPKAETKSHCDEGSKEAGCCSKSMVKNASKSKKAKACCAGGDKTEGKACAGEKAHATEPAKLN